MTRPLQADRRKRPGSSPVRIGAAGVALLLALSGAAIAEDGGRGIGYAAAGPIFELPAGVSVERQQVRVSTYSVELTYVFRSSGRHDIHFGFVMPEMPVDASPDAIGVAEGDEAAGLAADTRPVNYLDLSVAVDGRALALAGQGRALFEGRDVTRHLLDAGVPLLYDLVGETPWRHLAPRAQAMLDAGGLLSVDAAMWSYQASFAWDAVIGPGETRMEVRYLPSAAYWSDITLDAFAEMASEGSAARTYCIDDAVRRAFLSGRHHYELYTVTHLAAPPGGWRGPAGRYRLVVDKEHATDLVAFCPLAARKVSPTRFEWTASGYMPGEAVGVLFFWDTEAQSPDGEARREK